MLNSAPVLSAFESGRVSLANSSAGREPERAKAVPVFVLLIALREGDLLSDLFLDFCAFCAFRTNRKMQGLSHARTLPDRSPAEESKEEGFLTALASHCASVEAAGLVLITPPSHPPSYIVLSPDRLVVFADARFRLIGDGQDDRDGDNSRVFGTPFFETVNEFVLQVHGLFYSKLRKSRGGSTRKKKRSLTVPTVTPPIDEALLFDNLLSLTFWLSEYDVWLQLPDREWAQSMLTLLEQMWARVGATRQSLDDFSNEGVTSMVSILQAKAHAVQLDFDLA